MRKAIFAALAVLGFSLAATALAPAANASKTYLFQANQNNDGTRIKPADTDPKALWTRSRKAFAGKSPCEPISGRICLAAARNATA